MKNELLALKEIIQNMEVNEEHEPGYTLFRLTNDKAMILNAILVGLFNKLEQREIADEEDNPFIH